MQAVKGFNVIATANDRDRGVNDLSSALRRRFNTVVLPLPADPEDEVRIVTTRVADLADTLEKIEAALIRRALVRADLVQVKAAEYLGISKSLLQYKLKKFGLARKGVS